MPEEIDFKIRWEEPGDNYVCIATALNSRTHRILAVVRTFVPVYTAQDFKAIFGEDVRAEVEKAAIGIVRNIAERTPQ